MTNDELYKVGELLLREIQRNRRERGGRRGAEGEGGRGEERWEGESRESKLSFDFQQGGGYSH